METTQKKTIIRRKVIKKIKKPDTNINTDINIDIDNLSLANLHINVDYNLSEIPLLKQIDIKKIKIKKPILKWVGGKTQIIDKLLNEIPFEINNYHEIFLGGGSVLFAILSYRNSGALQIRGNLYAYDVNQPLIYLYKNIQTSHIELYNILQTYINEYNMCEKEDDATNSKLNWTPRNIGEAKLLQENYYYWMRAQYNSLSELDKNTLNGSAMFLFLNKTCFRGMYRRGPNGFNVPFGHYKNPEIINFEHLQEIHELIQGVIFEALPFTESLQKPVADGDFIYMDPPYVPENSKSFVGYTENGFSLEMHTNLFARCNELNKLNKLTEEKIRFMMSNSNVEFVRQQFSDMVYKVKTIECKRAINSKKPNSTASEVIIKNF